MTSQNMRNQAEIVELQDKYNTNPQSFKSSNDLFGAQECNSAVLTVLKNGIILDCNQAAGQLLGWEPEKLKWLPISKIMPELAEMFLIMKDQVNPYLHFLSRNSHQFDLIGPNAKCIKCVLNFDVIDMYDKCSLKITLHLCS